MEKMANILAKAQNGIRLNHDEVIFLLSQREEANAE